MDEFAHVNVNRLNLRLTPEGSIIDVLDKGSRVRVLSQDESWSRIVHSYKEGFVASRFLTPEMKSGFVTATRLNFRKEPSGDVLYVLAKGDEVKVLSGDTEWLKVEVQTQVGYVSRRHIDIRDAAKTPVNAIPKFDGKNAISSTGVVFARKFRKGVFSNGSTSIARYIADNRKRFSDISDSLVSVMAAVSLNEGKYEAINTWDNAFLSAGIFQWTAGVASEAGELPALLDRFKKKFPQSFKNTFGSKGLNVSEIRQRRGIAPRGYFTLAGKILNTTELKEQLRKLEWAQCFWLAGQDDDFREVQTLHAMERVSLFYHQDNKRIGQFYIDDYISSQYGVALLLDQHVNRPGHVRRTLSQAVDRLANEIDVSDPSSWETDQEMRLIGKYLELRATTSMTDGVHRANVVLEQVDKGIISKERGSFEISVLV